MRLAPPLCCKLLRQVPTFFIIMKRLEALESSWEFKKKQQKTKTQEHTTASTATAMQTESSNVLIGNATSSPQQYMYSSSTLALYLWALWLKKGLQRAVLPPWRRDMSWVCLQCIICQQPETCFCLRSQLDGSLYTRGSEELTPRQEPFWGHGVLLAQARCPAPTATASRQLRAWAEKTSVCLQNNVCTSPLSHDFTFDLPLTNSLLEQHLLCVAQLSRRSIFRMEVKE